MKKTFKITIDTTSEEFKEAHARMEEIAASLGTLYVFKLTIRELIEHRVKEFLEKEKIENYDDLLLPLTLGNLDQILVPMTDWIDEDIIKSLDLEFKTSIEFKDGACWAKPYDFWLLGWPELKEGFAVLLPKSMPVKLG